MRFLLPLSFLLCSPGLRAQAPGWDEIWTATGDDVVWLTDLDGDLADEFAFGFAPQYVRVVHGSSRASLVELTPDPAWGAESGFGLRLASPGDLDGDGLGDLVVCAPDADAGALRSGAVRAYSSADWSTLWTLEGWAVDQLLGRRIHEMGDADEDGIPDLAVTSWYGRVRMVSGADGSIIWEAGPHWGNRVGDEIEWVQDRDGDGMGDLLVFVDDRRHMPVEVWSGRTGAWLDDWDPGWVKKAAFGANLVEIDDVDNDGWRDLIVSEYEDSVARPDNRLTIASGRFGTRIAFQPVNDRIYHDSISALGDWDGDGLPEVHAGGYVYSIGTGHRLAQGGGLRDTSFGGDAQVDGVAEVLGIESSPWGGEGRIVLYGIASPTLEVGPTVGGSTTDLTVRRAGASSTVSFLASLMLQPPVPLGRAYLLVGPNAPVLGAVTADSLGVATLANVPVPAALRGKRLYLQAVVSPLQGSRFPSSLTTRDVL